MSKQSDTTRKMIMAGMMTAVVAVMSQIQFPLPSGVPVTMQTFAVALCAYVLGWKYGLVSTFIYILVGAVGVPVFAGFSGGISFAVSPTGGYIWGFLPMAALCGLGSESRNKLRLYLFSLLGLAACHLFGSVQLAVTAGLSPLAAFAVGSAPYLVKDVICMAAAYWLSGAIRRALQASGAPA
ncbi:MAG: biotin transporter BioY [Clostridiales bacterium]|nr:biotin transporter BioY [Clostridiales bacterium]